MPDEFPGEQSPSGPSLPPAEDPAGQGWPRLSRMRVPARGFLPVPAQRLHLPNRFAVLPALRPLPSQRPHFVSGQIRSEMR